MVRSSETVSTRSFPDYGILMSRTDQSGVIQAGNYLFEKLSGHEWDDLHEAPHKIIRHPEMPKGVFQILWDRIQAGKACGFFAKNLIKDGGHYWTYAFVSPLNDGYLSVQIKPSLDGVQTIAPLYEELVAAEETMSPEQSRDMLLSRLADLGYASFDEYMSELAFDQLTARAQAIGAPINPVVQDMLNLRRQWKIIEGQCQTLADLRKLIVGTPINLRIQAKQLDARGGALGVIATNYTTLADDVSERMATFLDKAEEMAGLLERGCFLNCMTEIQREFVRTLHDTKEPMAGIDSDVEIDLMEGQMSSISRQVQEVLVQIGEVFRVFRRTLTETERILSGLSVTRVMCKIENAYTPPDARTSIDGTVRMLQRFCDETAKSISDMRASVEAAENLAIAARTKLSATAGPIALAG